MNAIELVWPTSALILYGSLIGFATRAAVGRWVRFPKSLAQTVGVGLAVSVVVMALSYRFAGNVTLPIVPVAGAALLSLAWQAWHTGLWRRRPAVASRLDLIAFLAAAVVIFPVTKFGATYWTSGTADFPSYASSAEIWMTSPAEFAARHPDNFGMGQLRRASFEKPMATALLALGSAISGLEPYRWLTPIMFVGLFVLFGSLLTIATALFRLDHAIAACVVLLPSLSIVPLSRLYDAQLGHVAAAALVACFLGVVLTPVVRREPSGTAAAGIVAAVVGTAALGTNFTLLAGTGIMLAGLLLWCLAWSRRPWLLNTRLLIVAAACGVVLSLPFVSMYLVSFARQSSGRTGFPVPLASPLALVAQQGSLTSVSDVRYELVAWGIFGLAFVVALWTWPALRRSRRAYATLLGLALLNVVLIAYRTGLGNYAVHKWFTIAIALLAPLVAAHLASALSGPMRRKALFVIVPLMCSASAIAISNGQKVTIHAPKDLLDLRDHPQLAGVATLNIKLRDQHENAIAALVVPALVVNVVGQTYAPPSIPRPGDTLVPSEITERDGFTNIRRLNDSFSLASMALPLTPGK